MASIATKKKSIFSIPDEVLTDILSPYLTQIEQNRLFASCTIWDKLLKDVRMKCLTDEDCDEFLYSEDFRRKVMRVLGYSSSDNDDNSAIRRKIIITGYYGKTASVVAEFVLKYEAYVKCIRGLYKTHPQCFQDAIRQHPHFRDNIQGVSPVHINIPFRDIYKLTRIRVNQFHELEGEEALTDASYSSPQTVDGFEKKTLFQSLRGIRSIKNLSEQNLECVLYAGAELEDVSLSRWEGGNECLDVLAGVPSVSLYYCFHISNISILAKAKKVVLTYLPALDDVSPLKDAVDVSISQCLDLVDVSALGRVHRLYLYSCPSIVEYPKPEGKNQHWSLHAVKITCLDAFIHLEKLTLCKCRGVEDISMLGHVKYLTVVKCDHIAVDKYPLPLGTAQEWDFEDVSITNLHGYHSLHRLALTKCHEVIDVSMLSHVHTLFIDDCKRLSQVTDLHHIRNLTWKIDDKSCARQIYNLEHIDNLTLSTSRSWSSKECDALLACEISHLKNIHTVNISKFNGPLKITDCDNIHTVCIEFCNRIDDVSAFAAAKMVSICFCAAVQDVTALQHVEVLDYVKE